MDTGLTDSDCASAYEGRIDHFDNWLYVSNSNIVKSGSEIHISRIYVAQLEPGNRNDIHNFLTMELPLHMQLDPGY